MSEHSVAYVGLDTSKLHNAVAIAEAGRDGEVRYLGEIDNIFTAATARLVRKLFGQACASDVLLRSRSDRIWVVLVSTHRAWAMSASWRRRR